MEDQKIYDVLVVGAGSGGASAAMYATRLNLKTIIVGEMPGGLITTTHAVENWPGIKMISGADLGMALLDHALSFGSEFANEKANSVEIVNELPGLKKGGFKIVTGSKEYFGKTVILATGTKHKELNVPGEKELSGRGVSYCALCDAGFFKEKVVAVVGGGDAAIIEALILAERASKVYLFVRKDSFRAEPVNIQRVLNNPKVEIRYNTEIKEINGQMKVESVTLSDGSKVDLNGVFVAIGHTPLSDLAINLNVALNDHKEIIINRRAETNVKGVFAAGDVTDSHFKQAIIAAAEGVSAAYGAYEFIGREF